MKISKKAHLVLEYMYKFREALLNLEFHEVINPFFIDESEIYLQYGKEAPIILDRIYYLAGLPRPDIGLGSYEKKKILEINKNINLRKLKMILRKYREKEIDPEDLFSVLKEELKITNEEINEIFDVFQSFLELKPEPTTKTLRSHMTASWFRTISELSEWISPPIKLFSIDWVFRREQKVDKSHLRYYHSASVVVADKKFERRFLNKYE